MSNLVVFDFDFTIAKTSEKIWVWSPRGTREHNGEKYIPVHPTEFHKRQLADDEQVTEESFKEFYDIDINKAKPILPIIRYIRYHTELTDDKVIILTARPQCVKDKVMGLLNDHNVITTDIDFIGLAQSSAEAKLSFLEIYVKQNNIKSLLVYEDSVSVIKCVKSNMGHILPCSFARVTHGSKLKVSFDD